MIEYSEEVIKNAQRLKCRFALLRLIWECNSHYNLVSTNFDTFDWARLSGELKKLLLYYDNGDKLNEDFFIKLNKMKFADKRKIKNIERLIKLTKIV